MISINADSLRASIEEVRKRGIEAKALAVKQYRAQILEMFSTLLAFTPQFSGEMVYNWELQVDGESSTGYRQLAGAEVWQPGAVPEREAGDMSGPAYSAYMRALRASQKITRFGQPVKFINHSPLEIDSPIITGDDGSVQQLRDGVVVFAWVSITSYLKARYGA